LNRDFGAKAAGCCDYAVLVRSRLNDNAEAIREGLLSAGFGEGRLFLAESLGEALKTADAVETGGRPRVILLENDLPDNY
jgi:hypothetical protein